MKLGFIGLGNMGYGMASNLLNTNHEVIAFDIDDEKLDVIVKLGAERTKAIKEIAESVEIVVLCLPRPKISKDVIFNNLLTSKNKIKIIIDTSTLTPEDTEEIYSKLKKLNVDFLCSPMLGGKNAALSKKIHFLVEGDKNTFTKCKALFTSMGNRVDYMGNPPSATLAKLAYNICRYSNLATAVQVAKFLKAYTKDTKSIYELLAEGSLDNFGQVWKEDIKEMVLDGVSYKPSNIPEKDLTLIMQLAEKRKLSDKLFKAIRNVYRSLVK